MEKIIVLTSIWTRKQQLKLSIVYKKCEISEMNGEYYPIRDLREICGFIFAVGQTHYFDIIMGKIHYCIPRNFMIII